MKRFLVLLILALFAIQISYALDVNNLPVISSGSSTKSEAPMGIIYSSPRPYDNYYYGRNMYYNRGYFPTRTVVTTYYNDPYYYADKNYYGIICLDKKTGKTIHCSRIRVKRSDYICINKITEETVDCP